MADDSLFNPVVLAATLAFGALSIYLLRLAVKSDKAQNNEIDFLREHLRSRSNLVKPKSDIPPGTRLPEKDERK